MLFKRCKIKINSFQPIHQDAIDEMMQEIALEFEESIFSETTKKTSLPDLYWVVLNDDEVIGTIGLIIIDKKFGILKKMMLKKSFRGMDFGISKLLLRTVMKWCVENQISQIYLGTMIQFKAAQIFYKNNGFKRISKSELPSGFLHNSLDKVFFQKKL